jgi:glycosyl transferase family 25
MSEGAPSVDETKNAASGLPTFIVGLSSIYRGQALEEQLRAQNLCWTRIDGVDLRNQSVTQGQVDFHAARLLLRRDILPSEVGCALAHRKVYRAMVQHGNPLALVFEDDARLTGIIDQEGITSLLRTQVPRVFMLFFREHAIVGSRRIRGRRAEFVGIRKCFFPPTGTVAYAINLAAARLLLEEGRPVYYTADWPPASSTQIEYYLPSLGAIVTPDPQAESAIGDRPEIHLSLAARMKNYLLLISHITWLRKSSYYGSYRGYFLHEFVARAVNIRIRLRKMRK